MNITVRKSIWIVGLVAMLFTACKDKEAEKKIAALEARLSEIEGKSSSPVSATPVTPVAEPELKPDGPLPVFQWEKVEHDFGVINEGSKVSHTFEFTNNGEAPLIVQSAQPTCGCTVSDYSKEPIPVGGKGFVTAEFDSSGKPGVQNKTVRVTANTFPKEIVLSFKAMVTPKDSQGPAK